MRKRILLLLIVTLVLISSVKAQELDEYNITFRILDDSEVNVEIVGCPDINIKVTIPKDSKYIKQTISNCTTIEYQNNIFLEQSKSKTFFSVNVITPINTKELNVRVILPKGASIAESATSEGVSINPIFPINHVIGSDGKHILIEWNRKEVPGGGGLPLLVVYEQKRENLNLIIIITSILIILTLTAIFMIIKRKPKEALKTP